MLKMQEADLERQSELKYLLERLDEQIRIELDLIGQRMNVLAVSQAFLFTAYATNLANKDTTFVRLEGSLLWLIPVLGVAVSIIIGLSLFAPVWVVRARKKERDVIRDRLRQDLTTFTLGPEIHFSRHVEILEHVSRDDWEHKLGNWPPVLLAPVILSCWLYLLHVAFS